tara:strand:+ start:51 stop:629 length:579 start_codon:yes stop_codon:yes gene_type:complete
MKSWSQKFKNGRYVENKATIAEHLGRIDQNARARKIELMNLMPKVKRFFVSCGYPKSAQNETIIKNFIKLIFQAQDGRCGLWIQTKNDEINGVWNNPGTSYKHWHSDWINYEVDHVVPVNSDGEDNLQNVQFLSPNANRFIKCSMTNEQLLRRIDLSDRLKERIREVQEKRASLFASIFWRDLIDLIAETEK